MNIIKRYILKKKIEKEAKKQLMIDGVIDKVKVFWDGERNQFAVTYNIKNPKNIEEVFDEAEIEEEPLNKEIENEC